MKKKLFTLLLCAFAVTLTAYADASGVSYVKNETTGYLEITLQSANDLQALMDNSDAEYAAAKSELDALIRSNTKIKLSGNVGSEDLNKIKDRQNGVTDLDFSDALLGSTVTVPGDWKNSLASISLPTDQSYTTTPTGFCGDCINLTSVTIPSNITTLGNGSFGGCTSLVDLDLSNATGLVSLGDYAFSSTAITNLDLPASVKYINANAFENCKDLLTVNIPAESQLVYIKSPAFTNIENLRDVYIGVSVHDNTDPTTSGQYPKIPFCELNAFDFENYVDQTDVKGENLTELHFPDTEEDFEFYCGSWKEGIVFTQKNLNDIKDGYIVEGTKLGPNNGWQQFAKTGSPREVLVEGELLRTFSDEENYIVPTGIHVYRATAYTEASTGGTLTLTEITYQKGTAHTETRFGVPGSTGVILKSGSDYLLPDGAGDVSKFYLSIPDTEDTFIPYPWQKDAGHNWLYPTLLGGDEISSADWSGKTVINRNFGFRVDTQDFRRLKKGKLAANKAYLKLPAEITQSLAEVNDGPSANFSDTSAGAKIAIIFEDADLSQTTSLKNVDEIVKNAHDNSFYTLEGVKVNAPMAKGIYVHNGKKVVIK